MNTATQNFGLALATANALGPRTLGSHTIALYLTIDEAKRVFTKAGFNTRSSRAWRNQMLTWADLGIANVSDGFVILFRPEEDIAGIDRNVVTATCDRVRSFSAETGLSVVGWEA